MTETREVFEMVTKQTEPDIGSWRDQERHQRKRAQRRKAGAFVVVAALVVAGGVIYALTKESATTSGIADQPTSTPTSAPTPGLTSAWLGFIDLTTGATSTIPILPASSVIAVSPDGTQIAYVDALPNTKEVVHIADIDGSNVHALEGTRTPEGPTGLHWSPDGSSIVYQGDRAGDSIGNLYVVNVSSGQATRITDTEGMETTGLYYMSPSFDPTGDTVLFDMPTGGAQVEQQHWDLWSVPVTGGEPTLVRRGAIFGDYSPDGSQIAFIDSSEGFFEDLWVAPTAGGEARKLASGEIAVPRWSPDGTRIAYNDGSGGVYLVDVETGEKTLVIESERIPEWVDDDTLSLSP